MPLAVQDVSLGNLEVLLVHQLGLNDVLDFLDFQSHIVIEDTEKVLQTFNELFRSLFIAAGYERRFHSNFDFLEVKG